MPKAKRATAADFFGIKGIKCRHHAKYRKTCSWCDFETWWQMCMKNSDSRENFRQWRLMIGKSW